MINFEKIKMAFFDFDDTLCIHLEHKNSSESHFHRMAIQEYCSDKKNAFGNCAINQQMKSFMHLCKEKGIQLALISTTDNYKSAEQKCKWVNDNYGIRLENCCVGTQEAKLDMIRAISEVKKYEPDKILFVDDYWYQTTRLADAGFQAASPMEIVNFINEYKQGKEKENI